MEIKNFQDILFAYNNDVKGSVTSRKQGSLNRLLKYEDAQLEFIQDMIQRIQKQLNNGSECTIAKPNNLQFKEEEFKRIIEDINIICTHRHIVY